MGSEIPGNQNAQVSNDGFILGTEAGIISFSGNGASVNNAGTIRVGRAAFSSFQVDLLGDLVGGIMLLGDDAAIVNTGDILVGAANAYGIAVAGQGTMIENAGLIQTSNATSLRGAVTLFAPVAGITTFTNLTQGSVVSGVTAVLGGDGNDRIINLGLLSGDVVLAGGDGQGRQCGGYPWRCAVGGGERYL